MIDDDGYWQVGYPPEQYITDDFVRVGCILFIAMLKEWGVGTVLRVDQGQDRCKIHWQRLDLVKWHNTSTLLHYINQDYDESKKKNYNKSFIIMKGKKHED